MRCKLSKRVVEAAKPLAKPYEIRDTEVKGLLLRVQPSGVCSYIVEWARGKRVTLGAAGVWTVEKAKTEARRYLLQAIEGGEPVAVTERRKRSTKHAGELIDTLEDLLTYRYGPWVQQEHKDGGVTLTRIRKCFAEWLPRPLQELTAWRVEKWRAARLQSGIKTTTVNRDVAALRAALAKAVEWGALATHPLATVKQKRVAESGVVRWLSFTGDNHEEGRLRAALNIRDEKARAEREQANVWRRQRNYAELPTLPAFADHLTPLVLLAMNTGLRKGELTALTWADVDLDRLLLTVRAAYSKSGKPRHVPLNRDAAGVLNRWRLQCRSEKVFDILDAKKSFAGVLKAAGISGFRFHDLRHHFASRLVMAGVDLNTVRELLGHADLKMTLRYAHLAPEFKAAAVERLTAA